MFFNPAIRNLIVFLSALFLIMDSSYAVPLSERGDTNKIEIVNKCKHAVYYKNIFGKDEGKIHKIDDGDKTKVDVTSGHLESAVVKVSYDDSIKSPAQFEFSNTDMLYYDISLIDGHPFISDGGLSMTPVDGKQCTKKKLSCKKSSSKCSDAYYESGDRQTNTCKSWKGFKIVLCGQ